MRKLPSGCAHAQRAMELANEDVDHGDGAPHHLSGHRGDARADDRAGGNGLRHDHVLPRHRGLGRSPQPSELAAGISTALFATLEGIAVSIPAIFFYALFRNRIARLSLEVGMAAEPLAGAVRARRAVLPGAGPGPPARSLAAGSSPVRRLPPCGRGGAAAQAPGLARSLVRVASPVEDCRRSVLNSLNNSRRTTAAHSEFK